MGLVESGAASSVIYTKPELLWPVPDNWTLEDAATVPLAYMQAFYCLVSTKLSINLFNFLNNYIQYFRMTT